MVGPKARRAPGKSGVEVYIDLVTAAAGKHVKEASLHFLATIGGFEADRAEGVFPVVVIADVGDN